MLRLIPIALIALPAQATINLTAETPLDPAAPVFTGDTASLGTDAIYDNHALRQSFQLTQDITVSELVFGLDVTYIPAGLRFRVYEVDDVNAATFTPGTLIADRLLPTLPNADATLGIELTGADQFFLAQRDTGSQGYAVELIDNDPTVWGNTQASVAKWIRTSTSASGGQGYVDGSPTGVSYQLSIVPEPSSLALVVIGGIFLTRRR